MSVRRAKKGFENLMPMENRAAGSNLQRIERSLITGEEILAAKIQENFLGTIARFQMRLFWD